MMNKLGEERVHEFRRSWDTKPEPLDQNSIYHPNNINTYNMNYEIKLPLLK